MSKIAIPPGLTHRVRRAMAYIAWQRPGLAIACAVYWLGYLPTSTLAIFAVLFLADLAADLARPVEPGALPC